MRAGGLIAYLVVVAVIAGASMALAPNEDEGAEMNWSQEHVADVPAKPTGVWTWVYDWVQGPALIQVTAEGTWNYGPASATGPNGDQNALVGANQPILAGAPIGALILKVGGSTAGISDGTVKLAGERGLVEIDANTRGPIFLTINDERTGLDDNSGQLQAKISIAQLTPPHVVEGAGRGDGDD